MTAAWRPAAHPHLTPVMAAATLSHTVWRNLADHGDPANLARMPEELRAPWAGGGASRRVPFMVDGVSVPRVRLDSNPDVPGLGIGLRDKVLTVDIAREWLPLLRLECATRKPGGN